MYRVKVCEQLLGAARRDGRGACTVRIMTDPFNWCAEKGRNLFFFLSTFDTFPNTSKDFQKLHIISGKESKHIGL